MRQNRIERDEALRLLRRAPQLELMERAHAARTARWPAREVTFVIDTNPNYTNVCTTQCSFCSFHRPPGHAECYTLTPAQMAENAAHARQLGATTMLLQGGHNPDLPFQYYLDLIEAISRSAPGLDRHFFSPAEIVHIAQGAGMSWEEVLKTFWDAGLRTMPGGGAEILVDRVRREVSPRKISAEVWLEVMRTAHGIGMKTSATMTYGHRETEEDIVEHLQRLRALQDETGGFYSFIPWSFKPGGSPLSKTIPESELPSYYVRIVAMARLILDNFPHIQASWFSEGWRAGQLALYAGADDFGGVLLEENVLHEAEHSAATTLGTVLTVIREAGFTPVQRSTLYKSIRRYPEHAEANPEVVVRKRKVGVDTHGAVEEAV